MTQKEIRIGYTEYSSIAEMQPADRELASEAIAAMNNAYAPYSHFHVGAAVRMSNSQIVRGSNQENAAFPSGLCAERTAMFAAAAKYPDKDMQSIAIAGGVYGRLAEQPATPCGACRQVMAQYQTKAGKPMSIIMIGSKKIWKFDRVDDILPLIFDSI
ncbi:MAG: cytidine deaminase [Bacteroidales bacterium]|nr:cytidine deaminase [Bacteroidales bacterium]